MRFVRLLTPVAVATVLASMGAASSATRDQWLPRYPSKSAEVGETAGEPETPTGKVIVGEQAQQNLGLTAKPLKAQTYWKSIQVPGMVVDRPGLSDRNIVAPATGVVAQVNHLPGDTVRTGDVLFTLKLLSESLHLTQTDLFKTTQDITVAQERANRVRKLSSIGTESELAALEAEAHVRRLTILTKAYRQELLNRSLSLAQVDAVANGLFVKELTVVAPAQPASHTPLIPQPGAKSGSSGSAFEVQELKVELGQQVQAGQTLCLLANHQSLSIEGRAFRDETTLLERSVKAGWPVEVDFQEEGAADWGDVNQTFRIRHMANTIDPVNRTFAFQMPLENQSRVIEDEARTQTLWRFRPGQKVRLMVRVEKLDGVFVLPADAVTREGPEAFVFTQNVNTFARKPVRILLQDRKQVVLANDGSLSPGTYVVQGGAAQLNRLVKAGGSSGVPKGYHIHADGSLHKNEDEGK